MATDALSCAKTAIITFKRLNEQLNPTVIAAAALDCSHAACIQRMTPPLPRARTTPTNTVRINSRLHLPQWRSTITTAPHRFNRPRRRLLVPFGGERPSSLDGHHTRCLAHAQQLLQQRIDLCVAMREQQKL